MDSQLLAALVAIGSILCIGSGITYCFRWFRKVPKPEETMKQMQGTI